jgi:hypothetical protein
MEIDNIIAASVLVLFIILIGLTLAFIWGFVTFMILLKSIVSFALIVVVAAHFVD